MSIVEPLDWLTRYALPFWSENGFDAPARGAWEGLDHEGKPLPEMIKRMRVQARQTLVFAAASAEGHGDFRSRARAAFAFLGEHAYDAEAGQFHALLKRDGVVTDPTQDLYDLAFVLLALVGLKAAGEETIVSQWLPRWHGAVKLHEAPRGWTETPAGRLPRRQNPHMHLFEATVCAYEVFGTPAFLDMAEACLALFNAVFLDTSSGLVLEHFDADWNPVSTNDQIVEPGHMVEWVFLLAEYERVTGKASGVDLRALFDRAIAIGMDDAGFLVDQTRLDSSLNRRTRRLWPQTEFLKAAKVLQDRGEHLPEKLGPSEIYERMYGTYLTTPKRGGWFDCFDLNGKLVSDYMPSSTFYHLYSAITVLTR